MVIDDFSFAYLISGYSVIGVSHNNANAVAKKLFCSTMGNICG